MPTPSEIREKRQQAGLTQAAAAALIGKPVRTWQNWEAPEASREHRKMDAALYKLFLIEVSKGAP